MSRIDGFNNFFNSMRLNRVSGSPQTKVNESSEVKDADFKDFNFKAICKSMGAIFIRQNKNEVEIEFNKKHYILNDNGGEINFYEIVTVGVDDVPYWNTDFTIGDKTLAYRIKQTLIGQQIDYKLNLD